MRALSASFMDNLLDGFLTGLREKVIEDMDLDLQIRNNYLNIYFKGNSLLKLSEAKSTRYRVDIHKKFTDGIEISDLTDEKTTNEFLRTIPFLKENIIRYGKSSLEVEYEQLIIRSNNNERRNNSEYFIVDRQYTDPKGRFDLVGIFWAREGRKKHQDVSLCLMEVKFALNPDIAKLHEQLGRYHDAMEDDFPSMAIEFQTMLRQKLDLGLFNQPEYRVEAMKTLKVLEKIDSAQFIVFLIDYNPYSRYFNPKALQQLPFSNQIKIFQGGFGMWQSDLKDLEELL